jgi:hypothetical protein
MKITFFHSSLCPRCAVASRHLNAIKKQNPSLEIEKVDVLLSPRKSLQAGIRLIPALKINNNILSGIFLNHEKISSFISSCSQAEKSNTQN